MTNKQKESIVNIICILWIIIMLLNWCRQAYEKKKNQNTRPNIVYDNEFDDDFYDDDFYDDDFYDADFYYDEYAI